MGAQASLVVLKNALPLPLPLLIGMVKDETSISSLSDSLPLFSFKGVAGAGTGAGTEDVKGPTFLGVKAPHTVVGSWTVEAEGRDGGLAGSTKG